MQLLTRIIGGAYDGASIVYRLAHQSDDVTRIGTAAGRNTKELQGVPRSLQVRNSYLESKAMWPGWIADPLSLYPLDTSLLNER